MHLPPLTIKLLWAAAVSLLLPFLLPQSILVHLMLWPIGEAQLGYSEGIPATIGFMPWQLVTHIFLSTSIGSLLFIGLTLVYFGAGLEYSWGQRRYGLFLLACALGAGLVQLLLLVVGTRLGILPFSPVAGATGVMFGILFACAYLNPRQRVMLMIPPVEMQMQTLVAVFCALEIALGVFGSPNGLAHLGFLGGMLAAWLHIRYWRGDPPFKKRRPPGPRLVR